MLACLSRTFLVLEKLHTKTLCYLYVTIWQVCPHWILVVFFLSEF